ncbi:MAG: hypothetical protein QOI10_3746 [Solirubrobacterales bacterium]|jgi:hypothetical protein|nr:hypothetical protein [Solirubrobacterales bacterium]
MPIEITTLTTAAIAAPSDDQEFCDVRRTCEGVHTVAGDDDSYYVIVTKVTHPETLRAFRGHIGAGEELGTVRKRIIDEVPR